MFISLYSFSLRVLSKVSKQEHRAQALNIPQELAPLGWTMLMYGEVVTTLAVWLLMTSGSLFWTTLLIAAAISSSSFVSTGLFNVTLKTIVVVFVVSLNLVPKRKHVNIYVLKSEIVLQVRMRVESSFVMRFYARVFEGHIRRQ